MKKQYSEKELMVRLVSGIENYDIDQILKILEDNKYENSYELAVRFCLLKKSSNAEIEEIYKLSNGLESFSDYLPSALCVYLQSNFPGVSEYMKNEFVIYLDKLCKLPNDKINKFNIATIKESLLLA